MKNLLILSFLLAFINASAQNVSGLYMGTLVNDSTKQVQNYELALSDYRGKITGYSYTTFTVNDTFYYGIKRVKATIEKDELVVEDVKMLVNNFPESPAKGVRKINYIPLNGQDSVINLNGRWKTTQTKVYYSLKGNLEMRKEGDSSKSALISHLVELDLLKEDNVESKSSQNNIKQVSNVKPELAIIPSENRKTNIIQTIEVAGDSLHFAFYDNGVVDGDSITVFLNDQNILSKNKLTGFATKKKISFNSFNAETVQMTLIAENLGSIPPNTGLLIVQDGEKRHEIHFSADLQTNAGIIFRKRKSN